LPVRAAYETDAAMARSHWLVKQEPTAYSFSQLQKDKKTAWTGVRNHQARNNLAAMRKGDAVLFYHSVVGKEVVGVCEVVREHYPDPTADDPAWVAVDLKPVAALAHPVALDAIKAESGLASIPLLKQSRLSVMPLEKAAFDQIVALGAKAPTGAGGRKPARSATAR
jgi:predicted RNA-binding protein with PUA-like domain